MPLKNYTFTAGEKKKFAAGNMLRLIDTTAPVTVRFYKNGQEIQNETAESVEAGYAGRPERLRPDDYAFDMAEVESATAQTIKVLTTKGETDYQRTVNDVQAEPKLTQSASEPVGADALTANGFAFVGFGSQVAVAGEYSHVQLKNPAASGKVLFIDSIEANIAASNGIQVSHYDADLTTLVGQAKSNDVGGTDSTAQIRRATNVALLGSNIRGDDTGPGRKIFDYDFPLRLGEGEAIVVAVTTANVQLNALFKFREYA